MNIYICRAAYKYIHVEKTNKKGDDPPNMTLSHYTQGVIKLE